MRRPMSGIDGFTLGLILAVLLATLVPATGVVTAWVDVLVKAGVMLLFLLHGARLPRETVLAGLRHWRLQLLVLGSTFVLFPLLGAMFAPFSGRVLEPTLALGLGFLCCLPSTVQSSISFTAVARGNVAAAVCAASASNLLGVLVTPLLTGALLSRQGGLSMSALTQVATLLLLPFVVGQMLQPMIGRWVHDRGVWLGRIDRSAVLLMVYSAFGHSITSGLWSRTSWRDLAVLLLCCGLLFAGITLLLQRIARRLGLAPEDEVVAVFCGAQKSLVTGVPFANVLFAPALAGAVVLPLMIYHQLQLLAGAALATRYARRRVSAGKP